MQPTSRIVFDWGHRGATGVRREIKRPRPTPPPPPKWNCDPLHPFPTSSISSKLSGRESPSKKQIEIITVNDSPPRIMEYNHGLDTSFETNDIIKKEYSNSDCFLRNPFFKGEYTSPPNIEGSEKNTDKPFGNQEIDPLKTQNRPFSISPSNLSDQTENSDTNAAKIEKDLSTSDSSDIIMPSDAATFETHFRDKGQKRKNLKCAEKEKLEDIIGQKISKRRVGTPSRLYAKPSKKHVNINACQSDSQECNKLERSEISIDVPVGSSISLEVPVMHTEPNHLKPNLLTSESNFETQEGSAVYVENVVIDVSPYDIHQFEITPDCPYNISRIEEELRMMGEGDLEENSIFHELPLQNGCENVQDDDIKRSEINIRNDIWDTDLSSE